MKNLLGNMTEEKVFDVCVIGAGVSGMSFILLIRSNFGKKLCMQMYFQSLKVRFQMRIKIPE